MKRKVYSAEGAVAAGPYSHGVVGEDFLFLSGQTSLDVATGKLAEGGIAEQTRKCFENLFAVLSVAGLKPSNVVKVQVFLTDIEDFAAMNEVYAEQFKAPYPARTTLGVAALPLGASIEIEMIAKRKKTKK